MSKFISLGLLAFLLSLLASPVIAESGEECEVLKGVASPGLYGLCLAYHNAGSSDAMQKILDKYNKKKGPDDPVMPGTEEGVPCPCWTIDQLESADAFPAFECHLSSDPVIAIYGTAEADAVAFLVSGSICFYSGFSVVPKLIGGLDQESELACRAGIQTLVDMDFTPIPIDCT